MTIHIITEYPDEALTSKWLTRAQVEEFSREHATNLFNNGPAGTRVVLSISDPPVYIVMERESAED
jgi:hypothetical protein